MTTGQPIRTWFNQETSLEFYDTELYNEFHSLFLELESAPMLFPMEEHKIIDEMGYELTSLCYQYQMDGKVDLDQFVRNVYAIMGIQDHAEVVISMTYAALAVVNWPPIDLGKSTLTKLRRMNKGHWCGKAVERFIQRVSRNGILYENGFTPSKREVDAERERWETIEKTMEMMNQTDEEQGRIEEPENDTPQPKVRTFTLEEIVECAISRLTLEASYPVQTMLYSLLVKDGTPEERALVDSINQGIRERGTQQPVIGQFIFRQNNVGDPNGIKAILKDDELKKLLKQ